MIQNKVIALVHEQFLLSSEDEVHIDSDLFVDLGGDSLDMVELVMAMEEVFDIVVKDEEVEDINTVQDIVTLVTRLNDEQ